MRDFARLLEAEIPRLRRYARALTRDVTRADDLVQSCLTRAIAKQNLWEFGTDLRAWLLTILHNLHVNDVRRSMREGTAVALDDDLLPTVNSSAFALLQLRDLERALAQLREEERAVILLVALEGVIYEDAARILNLPVGTVRSRLSRGRQHLRQLMDIDQGPERQLPPAESKSKGPRSLVHEAPPRSKTNDNNHRLAIASGSMTVRQAAHRIPVPESRSPARQACRAVALSGRVGFQTVPSDAPGTR